MANLNYGNYTQPNPFSIKQQRGTALQELKAEIEKAISDEMDAQKMYAKMTTLALKAGMSDFAIDVDLIRGQENNHERIFRARLQEVLNTIT
jgi:rubrerythrin